MSSRVRLLPTLMGAAGVLLALRIGAMASTPAEPPEPAGSEQAAEPADQASGGNADKTPQVPESQHGESAPAASSSDAHGGEAAGQSQVYSGLAQTKGEADVLQKLGDRRAALDARERDLGLREQLLLAAEKQIAERLANLKGLEQKLDVMMAKRNELEEAQLVSLVKSYENMKPDDAARIFNRLERTILVDVASRMKPVKIGAVLAAMEPSKAQDLTVMLAKRMRLSQLTPVVPPVALPAPPAPVEPVAEADTSEAPAEVKPAAESPPHS